MENTGPVGGGVMAGLVMLRNEATLVKDRVEQPQLLADYELLPD